MFAQFVDDTGNKIDINVYEVAAYTGGKEGTLITLKNGQSASVVDSFQRVRNQMKKTA